MKTIITEKFIIYLLILSFTIRFF